VTATVVEVDFEHHDLATRRIDQQILDLAHFATVQRAHFPTTDVRLARRDAVILQLIDRVQSPAELGVGADTGCVAPDPFVPRDGVPPRRWGTRMPAAARSCRTVCSSFRPPYRQAFRSATTTTR